MISKQISYRQLFLRKTKNDDSCFFVPKKRNGRPDRWENFGRIKNKAGKNSGVVTCKGIFIFK